MWHVKYLEEAQRFWSRLRSIGPDFPSSEEGRRWSQRLSGVTFVILLVPVTAKLAGLTWTVLPEPESVSPALERSLGPATTESRGSLDISVVTDAHLFGLAGKTAPRHAKVVDAPETKLNLLLVGVFFAEDAQEALAIIGTKGAKQSVYGVGATLPGAATVEEIHLDKVLLRRNGRLEVLKLQKDAKKGSSLTRKDLGPSRTSKHRVDHRANRQLSKLLGRYQKKARSDPMSLSELVAVEPARKGNALVGFKLGPGKDPRLLRRFGLRPGDVVVSVNGIDLSSSESMPTVAEEFMNAKEVNLDVMRAGRKLGFSYKVE